MNQYVYKLHDISRLRQTDILTHFLVPRLIYGYHSGNVIIYFIGRHFHLRLPLTCANPSTTPSFDSIIAEFVWIVNT